MPILDASGSVPGTSDAAADAAVVLTAAAEFLAVSSVDVLAALNHLASARFVGGGYFEWNYFVEAAASGVGGSSASASGHRARGASAFFRGSSTFLYGALFPMQGASFFSVLVVVDVHCPPIKAITMGPKTFRWLQPLQRGDLSIFICDGRNAIVPWRVEYSLAQVRLDGSLKYVGPQHRTPVAGDQGEFYATGRAGESGQPGQWVIEWSYQRTAQSTVQRTWMPFQVLDAVAVGDPRELLKRKIKFGWS